MAVPFYLACAYFNTSNPGCKKAPKIIKRYFKLSKKNRHYRFRLCHVSGLKINPSHQDASL